MREGLLDVEVSADMHLLVAQAAQLDLQIQNAVFEACNLTPREIALLRATTPPRGSLPLMEAAMRGVDSNHRQATASWQDN